MSDYTHAFKVLIDFEGREYSDIPSDQGGPTKFGITIPTLSEHLGRECSASDIKALTEETARLIYRVMWWEKYGYGDLFCTEIATRILLASVLFGPSRGHKIIQRACNCAGRKIDEDGKLGQVSKNAINTTHDGILVPVFRAVCQGHVELKYEQRPSDREDSPGWMIRAKY